MANWQKKLTKASSGDLEPGERIETAVFLQPAGVTAGLLARELGGLFGTVLNNRLRSGSSDLVTDQGTAATMPDAKCVLGLTDRRVVIYGHSTLSGKPKGHLGSVAVAQIESIHVAPRKVTDAFLISFVDGTGRLYEAPKMANDGQAFADAVQQRLG